MKWGYLKKGYIYAVIIFLTFSCSSFYPSAYYKIEIGYKKFAIVKISIGSSVKLKYHGKIIDIGKMEQGDAPITIMDYNNKLFIVRLLTKFTKGQSPREYKKILFYEQDGIGLKEIDVSQFPREIALANFDSSIWRKVKDKDGKIIVDRLKVERDRDIKSYQFRRSLTAHLWYHLETGEKYYDIVRKNVIEEDFLRDYIEKYKPVQLKFEIPKKISKKEAGF